MEFSQRLGHGTEPQAAQPSIGLLESSSIAKGFEIADAVTKVSPVQLLWARTVSPGNYVVLFAGEVQENTYAMERGLAVGGDAVLDHILIPNVHVDLVPAIRGPRRVTVHEALGIVEISSVASTILAADAAVKSSAVELIEVRLAMHMGGKGFFLVCGETGDVEEAVATGSEIARERKTLIRDVVIPRVSSELLEHIF